MQAICNPQTFHCHPISYSLYCWQKKIPNKQKTPKLFYKTFIYTHHLLELLKTSTLSHLHHRKPTAAGDSISPVITTLQLLAQHSGFHSCLIQLCCHIFFFSSGPAVYLSPRALPRPCFKLQPTRDAISHLWQHCCIPALDNMFP